MKQKLDLNRKATIAFFDRLQVMLSAGLPFSQAMRILIDKSKGVEKELFLFILAELEAGHPLSDTLSKFPGTFNAISVNLVRAGELSGALPEFLGRVRTFNVEADETQKKIKKALTYPLTLIGVSLVVVAIMITFVVPVFASMFSNSQVSLPASTQFILSLSQAFRNPTVILTILGVAGFLFFSLRRLYKAQGRVRQSFDRWLTQAPIVGSIVSNYNFHLIAMICGSLLSAGIGMLEALNLSRTAVGNLHVKDGLSRAYSDIEDGQPVSESFSNARGVFSIEFCSMVQVGEQTGRLSEMFQSVSASSKKDFDESVARFASLLEPALTVIVGGVIGFILVAMYSPMFLIGKTI